MAFIVDENGDISLIQGDSGTLVIDGIDTDKNYTVYFAIRDKNRKPVGEELYVNSNNFASVVFTLTGDYTDLLTVDKNEFCTTYYYGVKLCDSESDFENTLVLGDNDISGVNTITVYPKKVEGI